MANQDNEVKDIERVEVEPSEDTELVDEEKETPAESSTEDKPAEEPEEPETPEEELRGRATKEEPKPVEGETPRERALRLEVQRLKQERRQERTKEIFTETPKKIELTPEDDVLAKYDPDEVKNLEEVVDVIAKRKGWVRREEQIAQTYQQTANDILDNFLEEHPEYSPENDNDDTLWNAFKAEYALYKIPENPKDLKKIFNRIHKDVFGSKDVVDMAKISAKQEKLKSHAGTTQSIHSVKSTIDSKMREHMKGFDDDELDELLS